MNASNKNEITILLKNLKSGDRSGEEKIMEALYQELRQFAGNILKKENQTITYQATELVNEAYLRMFDTKQLNWQDRNHFLATAITVMRNFLVDHARKKKAGTRIKKNQMDSIDDVNPLTETLDGDVVALHEVLQDLEVLDPRQAKVVELRFFGGLTETEVAALLGVSISTVNREWKAAKVWLTHQIISN